MDSAMWDARYGSSDLVWGKGPNRFLPPIVEGLPPGTALDVACGEGRNAIWLAHEGWRVTAVDFSPVAIEKARQLASGTDGAPEGADRAASRVEWVVADVTTYRPDRAFDLVVVFYLHLLDDDLAATFANAIGALAPGGTFFGVGHALRNLDDGHGGPPVPELLWTEERIRPLVDGLEIVEFGERDRRVEDADATAIDLAVHARRP